MTLFFINLLQVYFHYSLKYTNDYETIQSLFSEDIEIFVIFGKKSGISNFANNTHFFKNILLENIYGHIMCSMDEEETPVKTKQNKKNNTLFDLIIMSKNLSRLHIVRKSLIHYGEIEKSAIDDQRPITNINID